MMPKARNMFFLGQGWMLIGVLTDHPVAYMMAVITIWFSYRIYRDKEYDNADHRHRAG